MLEELFFWEQMRIHWIHEAKLKQTQSLDFDQVQN
jgi:hypothetical protein